MIFFYISNDKTDFTVAIVSQNLALGRISLNSETIEISRFLKNGKIRGLVSTWHKVIRHFACHVVGCMGSSCW